MSKKTMTLAQLGQAFASTNTAVVEVNGVVDQTITDDLSAALAATETYAGEGDVEVTITTNNNILDFRVEKLLESPKAIRAFARAESPEHIVAIREEAEDAAARRLQTEFHREQLRSRNRVQYQPSAILTRQIAGASSRPWKFSTPLKAPSLLQLVLQDALGEDIIQVQPWAETEVDGDTWSLEMAKLEDEMRSSGWNLLQGNIGIRHGSPTWKALCALFPTAIDLAAYGTSLINSPTMPHEGSVSRKMNVFFTRLCDNDGMELGTDGSGWCSSAFTQWPLQIRGLDLGNQIFAKGMIFPRQGFSQILEDLKSCLDPQEYDLNQITEDNTLILDLNQIKGARAAEAKALRTQDGFWFTQADIGVINRWTKPGKVSMCFEGLQQIALNERTRELIEGLVRTSVKRMAKEGVEGLLERACRDDSRIRTMVRLAKALGIPPERIPLVRQKVNDVLQSQLYTLTQGAGIVGEQMVLRLDATVPQGSCVLHQGIPGTKVAVTRYPMIMAQALKVLNVIEPTAHLCAENMAAPMFSIALNPADALDLQGDDDGDICLVSRDPKVIELFSHRRSNARASIELPGKASKFATPSDSVEGREWIATDHTGAVGLYTLWQAQLLSGATHCDPAKAARCGRAAQAFSLAIQAAVDAAKKPSIMVKLEAFSGLHNIWYKDDQGVYRVKPEWIDTEADGSPKIGFYDIKELQSVFVGTLFDCQFTWKSPEGKILPLNLIKAWRRRTKRQDAFETPHLRRIDEEMDSPVIFSYTKTMEHFQANASWLSLHEDYPYEIQIGNFHLDSEMWETASKEFGVKEFGRRMKSVLDRQWEKPGDRAGAIEECYGELYTKLSLAPADTWAVMISHLHTEARNCQMSDPDKSLWALNTLWAILSAPTCPLLGQHKISVEDRRCPASTPQYVGVAKKAHDPDINIAVANLWRLCAVSTRHQKIVEGVHIMDCPECMKELGNLMIAQYRADNNAKLIGMYKRLIGALNATYQKQQAHTAPNDFEP